MLKDTEDVSRKDIGVIEEAANRPMLAGDADNVEMAEIIMDELDQQAVPMEYVEFTRREYDRLFPHRRLKSPIEVVKLGAGQFEKLLQNGRENYLGAMHQTLTDPVIILEEIREGEKSHLYIKSFKSTENDTDFVMSVVVNIDGENITVSTGPRKKKQILKKLTARPLYIRGSGGPTAGTVDGEPSPLPVTSLSSNSADKSSPNSSIDDALFQLIEADADAAVEKYKDADAWMEADKAAEKEAAEAGDQFPADDDWGNFIDEYESYHKMFNEAKARKADTNTAPVTTSSADELFVKKIKNSENLIEFSKLVNGILYGGEQDRETGELVKLANQLPGIFTIGRDKKLDVTPTPSQLKSMRSLIRENPTQYRRLYTALTGDPEFKEYAQKEIHDKPYVEKAAKEGAEKSLTIKQQGRLALKFEATEIREAVKNGEISDERLKKVIEDGKLDVKTLEEQLKTSEDSYQKKLKAAGDEIKYQREWGNKWKVKHDQLKKEITAKIKQKVDEIKAAQRLLRDKQRMLKTIMKPAKVSIWHEERDKIKAIQALLYKDGQGKRIKYEGKSYPIAEFKKMAAAGKIDTSLLSARQAERLTKSSIAELTLGEMRELKETVSKLRAEGRANWKNLEIKRKIERLKKLDRLFTDIIGSAKKGTRAGKRLEDYKKAENEEAGERVIRGNVVDALGNFVNMYADEDIVFEGLGKSAKEILHDEAESAWRQREDGIYNRLEEILPDFQIKNADIARTLAVKNRRLPGIGPDGRDYMVSKADLITFYAALDNEKTKAHVLYGNLLSAAERSEIARMVEAGEIDPDLIYDRYGKHKEDVLREAVETSENMHRRIA
jgi:hypothetical protein